MSEKTDRQLPQAKGRAAQINPANRFARIHVEEDFAHFEGDDEFLAELQDVRTEYFEDDSQTILSENKSPDIPFRYSLNPYRGCAHGCAYCYARPTHEYLGFSAGTDFESKVLVKRKAPQLLREQLSRRSWQVEPITLSGVTDCYQPAERQFRITRGCLEVAAEFRQPLSLITKNALITRDLDLLSSMARQNLCQAAFSLTTLDQSLTRVMEPRTSSPQARLRAMRALADAGIPVMVMVAPVIPGLNDSEIPAILEAAKAHGAQHAGYVLLRLPLSVRPVFLDWLARRLPGQRAKIESLIMQVRGGQLNDSRFGERMRGSGVFAEHLKSTFKIFARKYGLDRPIAPLDTTLFCVPRPPDAQLRLF